MEAAAIACLVFVTIGLSGIAGLPLSRSLPGHHLDEPSRETVRLVASFLASLSALVLGLLVASAKANYDTRSDQLHRIAADVIALDRVLVRYGEGAQEARDVLRAALTDALNERAIGDRPRDGALVRPVRDARLLNLPTGFRRCPRRMRASAPPGTARYT